MESHAIGVKCLVHFFFFSLFFSFFLRGDAGPQCIIALVLAMMIPFDVSFDGDFRLIKLRFRPRPVALEDDALGFARVVVPTPR